MSIISDIKNNRARFMAELFQYILHGERNLLLSKLNSENINQQQDANSLLMYAIQHKQDDIALQLINLGINVNLQNNKGQTAMHVLAVYKNDLTIAEALIQHGADLSLQYSSGNISLWTAILKAEGQYDLVELLLKNKADLDSKNRTGKSPFDLALLMKFPECIALVEKYKTNH